MAHPYPTSGSRWDGWSGSFWTANRWTVEAVEEVRSSIGIYLVALSFNLLAALFYLGAALATGHPAGLGQGGVLSCNGSNFDTGAVGSFSGYSAAAGAFALIGFIVTLIAWLRWRSGVKRLDEAAPEYASPHLESARLARRTYGFTFWMFITSLLVSIVGVGVVAGLVASALASSLGPNGPVCTQALVDTLNRQLLSVSLAIVVASAVVGFLLYWFATESLVASIFGLAPANVQQELDGARRIILIGAILPFFAVLSVYSVYFEVFAALAPVLYLVGYVRFRAVYGRWLESPPPPHPPSAPPPGVLPSPALWGPPGSAPLT